MNQDDEMITLTRGELQKIVDNAAKKTLEKIGLDYPEAGNDVRQLISLFNAYRFAKKTVWRVVWEKLTTAAMTLFLVWIAAQCGFKLNN